MKRQPTEAQKAAAKERRAKVGEFVKIVAKMSPVEREAMAAKMPVVNTEGHCLSFFNQCLLAYQTRKPLTVVGGFKQWLSQGRVVAKGEHGFMILFPIYPQQAEEDLDKGKALPRVHFGTGTVFDITQTVELEQKAG